MPLITPVSHQSSLAPIALFKLLTGLLVLLAGAGFFRWVDPEIDTFLSPFLDALHLSTHTQLLHVLVLKVHVWQRHSLLMMGLISVGYAALLFIEGFGLWIETSWAAYLTVISTSVLLPSEFHAVVREISVTGLVVLAANVAIVGYLVRCLAEETLR